MRDIKEYKNMDEIVEDVVPDGKIQGVYSNAIVEDVGFIESIAAFLFSGWKDKFFVIGVVGLYYWGAVNGLPPAVMDIILTVGVLFLLFVFGKRISPGLIIVTEDYVYLINDVVKDRKTGMIRYDFIERSDVNEVESYFKAAKLNPIWGMFNHNFNINGKKIYC